MLFRDATRSAVKVLSVNFCILLQKISRKDAKAQRYRWEKQKKWEFQLSNQKILTAEKRSDFCHKIPGENKRRENFAYSLRLCDFACTFALLDCGLAALGLSPLIWLSSVGLWAMKEKNILGLDLGGVEVDFAHVFFC